MFLDREKKIQDQITVSRPSGEVLSGILLQPQSQYSITGPLEKTPTKSNKEIQQVIQSSAAVWIRHAQIFTSPQSEGMRSTATRVSGWNQLANPSFRYPKKLVHYLWLLPLVALLCNVYLCDMTLAEKVVAQHCRAGTTIYSLWSSSSPHKIILSKK
jgi:hypothetical protein